MKNRIIAASLAVIMAASLYACDRNTENKSTETDAVSSTTAAVTETATTQPATTVAETTTQPTTTLPTTTKLVTTTKKIATTIKKVTTTKATTAEPTTEPRTKIKTLFDYRTEEETYDITLRYGVVQRKVITRYYEKQADGTEVVVKEEISADYVDRTLYNASYSDLLPAAKENRDTYRQKIKEVLRIINSYRAEGGLAPLTLNEELTEIACVRAEEIAWSGDHDHTRPNLQSCFSLMRDNGFSTGLAGENIGWGFDSADTVCQAWKDSETHYENIMNPKFTETGIGIAADPRDGGKLCWAQYFYEG